ncbi:MAG TPA: tetratricopeptide repeat protein [Termitinemataceae bacterium]|nr:tetratricopeptide repeat protein [Termitinemataceae bacterium]HOM22369.1 tetratricopeptide repeat protein [Termitinemataceae bacterium]HPP99631.1 tetratricopeptide repeat protein [Termitinemataceae bacterium]
MLRLQQSTYSKQWALKKVVRVTIGSALLLFFVGGGILFATRWRKTIATERAYIYELWTKSAYTDLLSYLKKKLEKHPLDSFTLSVYGFTAYQMAMSQPSDQDMQTYLDECIWALRKIATVHNKKDPAVLYVLGKAYYYKGPSYADLAITYLEEAQRVHAPFKDIAEYLGMAYASVKDYRSSIAALSQVLEQTNKSSGSPDLILLAIARSYLNLENYDQAEAYLLRCVESSQDDIVIEKARYELALLYQKKTERDKAIEQCLAILALNEENAQAHFLLGDLYAEAGDLIRARSEWRRTLRIAPDHSLARARLTS